jgi:PmbA protein
VSPSSSSGEASGDSSDLLALAERVVADTRAGESLEVYVARGTDTEVRAFDGEVESLSSATSSGVGIRVLLNGSASDGARVGFAWAGSLDEAVVRDTLAEARDNAEFASVDPDVCLAPPDGHPVTPLDLWDDELASVPTDQKVAMALELERQVRQADPRIRQVSSADYGDERGEMALASTTGIRAVARSTGVFLSVSAFAG